MIINNVIIIITIITFIVIVIISVPSYNRFRNDFPCHYFIMLFLFYPFLFLLSYRYHYCHCISYVAFDVGLVIMITNNRCLIAITYIIIAIILVMQHDDTHKNEDEGSYHTGNT